MTAQQLVSCLLEVADRRSLVDEASVHLPHRGTRWVATFRDETGRQVWRSTGLTDRQAALALAKQWEQEARQKRQAAGALPKKPTIRVRPGSAEAAVGLLSQREVAVLLRISERAVRAIEHRAISKLRAHPALKQFWSEWEGRKIDEAEIKPDWKLSHAEMTALFGLAQTAFERHVIRKMVRLYRSATRNSAASTAAIRSTGTRP